MPFAGKLMSQGSSGQVKQARLKNQKPRLFSPVIYIYSEAGLTSQPRLASGLYQSYLPSAQKAMWAILYLASETRFRQTDRHKSRRELSRWCRSERRGYRREDCWDKYVLSHIENIDSAIHVLRKRPESRNGPCLRNRKPMGRRVELRRINQGLVRASWNRIHM